MEEFFFQIYFLLDTLRTIANSQILKCIEQSHITVINRNILEMRVFIGLFITLFFVNVGLVEANTKERVPKNFINYVL